MTAKTIVWFRGKDLRISDDAPLHDAREAGEVIPLFVLDLYFFAPDRARELPHRMQFLLDSLSALDAALTGRGSRLLVVPGESVEVVSRLVQEWKADSVVAQRWVEPFARERDRRVREALGASFELYEGETLWPPGRMRTAARKPYSVFSRFARTFRETAKIGRPLPRPHRLPPIPREVADRTDGIPTCEQLGIERNPALLPGGEPAANERLDRFLRRLSITSIATGWTSTARVGCRRTSSSAPSRRARCGRLSRTPSMARQPGRRFSTSSSGGSSFTARWGIDPSCSRNRSGPAFAAFPWQYDEQLWHVHGRPVERPDLGLAAAPSCRVRVNGGRR